MSVKTDLPSRVKKAARLIAEHRIHEVEGRVFVTRGDNGTYLTVIARGVRAGTGLMPPERSCTCEAGQKSRATCSHIYAAEAILESEKRTDPFAGIGANH